MTVTLLLCNKDTYRRFVVRCSPRAALGPTVDVAVGHESLQCVLRGTWNAMQQTQEPRMDEPVQHHKQKSHPPLYPVSGRRSDEPT